MSVAGTAFTVVSEFRFDVAHAVVGAETLQNAVDGISKSAQSAVDSITSMGMSFVAQMSGAKGGVIGLLYNAVSAADKFKASQIEIANAMVANKMSIGGQAVSFAEGLEAASHVMDKIVKKSQEMGISANEWVGQFKMFNNMLAPKGLSGKNMENAMELSRVSLKAAPALGVSGDQAQMGILAGISGQLSKDTHFGSRLFMEAGDAIKNATNGAIKDLKSFNAAKPEQRIKALVAGLDKLAGSADTISARANNLTSKLNVLKELFYGVSSILKPLGDAVMPLILNTLNELIKFLAGPAANIIKEFAGHIQKMLGDDPRALIKNLMDISDASTNLGRALTVAGIAVTMAALADHFHHLKGFNFMGIGSFFTKIGEIFEVMRGMPIIGPVIKMLGNIVEMFSVKGIALNTFGGALKAIGLTALRAAGFVSVLLIPLQGLSQAFNRASIEIFDWIKSNAEKISSLFLEFTTVIGQLFLPFTDMIKGFEELFFTIIGGTKSMDALLWVFRQLLDLLIGVKTLIGLVWSVFRGFAASVTQIFANLIHNIAALVANVINNPMSPSKWGGGTVPVWSGTGDAFLEEFTSSLDRFLVPTNKNGEEAQKEVKNDIYMDIKMNNHFKEVLQPDRIAYTITEQLKKASTFPTQRAGGGGSLASKKAGAT